MRSRLLTFLLLFTLCTCASAQKEPRDADQPPRDSMPPAKLYKTKPLIELPLTAVAFYFSQEKIVDFREKPAFTGTLPTLTNNDVPGIDQWGLRQDPAKAEDFAKTSDIFFITGQLAPFTLFVWKKYRDEWLDITTMYLEAQALQGVFYGYAPFGPSGVDRFRPRSYYDEVEDGERRNGNAQSSLFSGHVSTTATGWYFYAKIITDHNPDLTGGQKALIYGAASVPGVITSILRVKALKHFPTDTAVGMGVGAFSGIMVPEFHRWWQKRHEKSMAMLTPLYGNGAAGMGFTLIF
ncbi:phosphatase PAP2 family protein [Neolewinella aurantiaca]|uniref:Phosphatase PAP2 family protein n=1 Tax=Neolewinella aurantiaca TaxID=2602767 RepID=A0A5C7FEA1_9BACT|nr:phosphatase PAP2 family protein [Neolewinella aurantiaca]TXF87866.1 phosphatase PAP2 family protein [Neolewinella aurantiaca]